MEKTFEKVFKLMKQSFPKEEYRSYEAQKSLIKNPLYHLITNTDSNGNLIGFIAAWDMINFSFIEHFAIDPCLRGNGIGSKMLKSFVNKFLHPIILEVEVPYDSTSKKRVLFYERNGFLINNFEYFQVPLRKNALPIPMNLMSYPDILSKEEFQKIKTTIHTTVYGIKN